MFLREKQSTRSSGTFDILPDTVLQDLVENWFIALSDAELSSIQDPVTAQQKKLHAKATTWVHEHRLRLWVLDQNINKGLAPYLVQHEYAI